MIKYLILPVALLIFCLAACKNKTNQEMEAASKEPTADSIVFPSRMVEFTPYNENPIFSGTGADTWDKQIRERGFILFEDSLFKMWYTGFKNSDDELHLGYATSKDGINWARDAKNPIFSKKWTEDMCVVKNEGKYYMFAEGFKDVAHMLTSGDGINWQEQGDLVIRKVNGDTIPGPYGTPTVWVENGKWYLFYERNDEAIWLAVSDDQITWRNTSDEPVIKPGPDKYDLGAVAANQVVKYEGAYYLYYHAAADPNWATQGSPPWSSNVARSTDLIHWTKYPKNPIVEGDHSSPITVFDGKRNRLYTMHSKAFLYFSK